LTTTLANNSQASVSGLQEHLFNSMSLD
jgi:hypothetical protein